MKTIILITQRFILLLLITLLILPGCKKDEEETNVASLRERIWTLKYIQNTGSNFISYFPEIKEKITIEFEDNKQLIFDGVCNSGGGSYIVENDKLTISSIFTTEIYCNNIDWEAITTNGLVKANQFKIEKGILIINSGAGYNLVFE